MAILNAKERSALPDSSFAAVYTIPQTKNGRTRRIKMRKYPMEDPEHVRDALARFGQEKPPLPDHVKAKAKARLHAAAKKHGIDAQTEPDEAARVGKTGGDGLD